MRIATAACLLTGVVAVLIYYGTHDPAVACAPKCMLKTLTGYDCPGCGAQRALHAALNGNFTQAWSFNPLMFLFIPLAIAYGLVEFFPARFTRLRRILMHPATIVIVAVAIVGWWIIRNL